MYDFHKIHQVMYFVFAIEGIIIYYYYKLPVSQL